ncbi:molybdopterin-dependent oxidoreductase [Haloferax larsenii]|uniref:Oxidoreductase molybdopterin binding domain-containing protein n=1 Tax=Haloferax larsenii TaxID=302484 RepID=A0A1H7PAV8_HALLR|nr:molybdopterin-dependent oxidoreductase [Haloferax larsenii]SEL32746.1 Oxidoreductase molybdopterin binding domain-containing protein [Haloferax larsenii]
MTHNVTSDADSTSDDAADADALAIEIVGDDDQVTLGPQDFETFPTTDRECTIECASGTRTTGTWTGVVLADLLDRVETPPETTHVRVTSTDGYAVCVDIVAALDAIVAVARNGEPLAEHKPYATRFLGGKIDGARTVKGVAEIEPLALEPNADPSDLESMSLDDASYG